MKTSRYASCILAASVLAAAASCSALLFPAPPARAATFAVTRPGIALGLVGWWTFDGSRMVSGLFGDSSGNGNNVRIAQGATTTIQGKLGQALSFSGTNNYAAASANSAFNFGGSVITVSAWVDPSSVTGNRALVNTRNACGAPAAFNWQLYANETTSNEVFFDIVSGSSDKQLVSTIHLATNKWVFITATYDGSNLRLYQNGVLHDTAAATGVMNSNAVPLNIGNDSCGSFLAGGIDDVRIYKRALSPQEIADLYTVGASRFDVSKTGSSTPVGNGLVGYWTFDGKDVVNGVALDKSGNGNNGNLINIATSTFYAPGKIGQGFKFDGVDDYVSIPYSSTLNPINAVTVSAWIKTASTTAYILALDPAGCTKSTTHCAPYSLSTKNGGEFYDQNGGTPVTVDSSMNVADGKWHHILGTYDRANLKIFVDGVQTGSTANTNPMPTVSGPLRIGADDITTPGNFFPGLIDDVRIYKRALSPQEIADLYTVGASRFDVSKTGSSTPVGNGLVGYWTFDGKDVVNGVALDKSGNGNNGNLINIATSTFYAPGKIGQGFKFDGVDDYVSIPYSSTLNPINAVTVSAWIKTASTTAYILALDPAGCTKSTTHCAPYSLSTKNGGEFYDQNGGTPVTVDSSMNVADGKWHHILGTYDRANLKIFVDGVQTGSTANTNPMPTVSGPLRIGADDITTPGNFFPGLIDDVRIYNRALSAQEVGVLYNMGK